MGPTSSRMMLATADGVQIDAEGCEVDDAWASVVLCHPHPLHGGNRQAGLIGHLFAALPDAGVRTLRFDFRGVGRSTGTHGGGEAERADVAAALDHWSAGHGAGPMATVGWSFGADVSLATDHPAIDRWCGIAPPLAVIDPASMTAAHDDRPKLLCVPEHDEFRPPGEVEPIVVDWPATRVETVGGASHLLIGRYDAVTDLVVGFLRDGDHP